MKTATSMSSRLVTAKPKVSQTRGDHMIAAVTAPNARAPETVEPVLTGSDHAYATGTDAFSVGSRTLRDGETADRAGGRVALLICTEGRVRVAGADGEMALGAGETALVPAEIEGYGVVGSAGTSKVFEVASG